MEQDKNNAVTGLYYASLGQMVTDYVGRIHPAVIEKAMESRAVQTLEAIRRVLDDGTCDDPECFYRVDELVMLFFRELGVKTNRHNECE